MQMYVCSVQFISQMTHGQRLFDWYESLAFSTIIHQKNYSDLEPIDLKHDDMQFVTLDGSYSLSWLNFFLVHPSVDEFMTLSDIILPVVF